VTLPELQLYRAELLSYLEHDETNCDLLQNLGMAEYQIHKAKRAEFQKTQNNFEE
jgi:hypothetical protein